MKRGSRCTFELAGRTVKAVVRAVHRNSDLTVEACAGEWMGKRMRLPYMAVIHETYPEIERAFALDAARQAKQ